MIVPDLTMANNIETIFHELIILLVHIAILHPHIAHSNITIVLANAPLIITTPLLDDINRHIVLLLSHVLIAIKIDHTPILTVTLTVIINPLLISLNNPIQ